MYLSFSLCLFSLSTFLSLHLNIQLLARDDLLLSATAISNSRDVPGGSSNLGLVSIKKPSRSQSVANPRIDFDSTRLASSYAALARRLLLFHLLYRSSFLARILDIAPPFASQRRARCLSRLPLFLPHSLPPVAFSKFVFLSHTHSHTQTHIHTRSLSLSLSFFLLFSFAHSLTRSLACALSSTFVAASMLNLIFQTRTLAPLG
jgi:hypothetical protein